MITMKPPKVRITKRLRKEMEFNSLCRLGDPVGEWFRHKEDIKHRARVARYQLAQGYYTPPKLPTAPVNRVARYFGKLGIKPAHLSISPGVYPDVYGRDAGDVSPNPPIAPQGITSIAATSGSTASATFAMPTGYSDLVISVGDFPVTRDKLILYVKVDSTTKPHKFYPYGTHCLRGVAGKTISFGSQTTDRATNTTTNESVTIKVVPHIRQALVPPSGVTGTIQLDHGPPDRFTATQAQIVFSGEYQCFAIAPAPVRRDVFIIESDGVNDLPTRHVHIPANHPSLKVNCRYPYVAVFSASRDVNTLDITCPTGTVLPATDAVYWEPAFTPTNSVTVSDANGLKTALNTVGVDEVVCNPATYNMGSGSLPVDASNYSTMAGKTIRIRSSTNNPDDVIFTGAPWIWTPTGSNRLTIKGVTFNFAGVAVRLSRSAMLQLEGNADLINCRASGPQTDGDPMALWVPNASSGNVTGNALWCDFTSSVHDIATVNGLSSPSRTCRLDLVGCNLDGNGSAGQDQQLTAHTTGIAAAWGCRFKGTANSNSQRIISASGSEPIYLNYCYNRAGDFPNGGGLAIGGVGNPGVNPTHLLFCDFEYCAALTAMRAMIGTRAKNTTTNSPINYTASTNDSRSIGCDLYHNPAGVGFDHVIMGNNAAAEVRGSRLTGYGSAFNETLLGIQQNASGTKTLTVINVLLRVTPTAFNMPCLNMNSGNGGTHALAGKNIATDGNGLVLMDSSGTAASTCDGSRFRCAKPATWDSKVPAGTNVFSAATPLDLDAYDIPTDGGNCDRTGVDPGYVGSIDFYGRPFLGGAWPTGGAEVQEDRSGAWLYPMVWI